MLSLTIESFEVIPFSPSYGKLAFVTQILPGTCLF